MQYSLKKGAQAISAMYAPVIFSVTDKHRAESLVDALHLLIFLADRCLAPAALAEVELWHDAVNVCAPENRNDSYCHEHDAHVRYLGNGHIKSVIIVCGDKEKNVSGNYRYSRKDR